MQSLIEVSNLSKDYYEKKEVISILEDLNFKIKKGEIVSIVGPNGCGKTTLLRILSGLEEPTNGYVSIDPAQLQMRTLSPQFGFVFQNHALLPWQSIYKNLALPFILSKQSITNEVEEKIIGFLKKVELENEKDNLPHQLSGGERQRVNLIRSLIVDPPILIMDEPFKEIDEIDRVMLNSLLLENHSQEKDTIIFVTHSCAEAVFLSDKIIVLNGRPPIHVTKIKRIVTVEMSHPRMRESVEFIKRVECIRKELI